MDQPDQPNRPVGPRAGGRNAITDVPGIRVGHATRRGDGYLTGVTVVLPDDGRDIGAVGAVAVRGGGPGTRESDALDPRNLVPRLHAVVLTGGSAYGLASADGVMGWLAEHGAGYRVGAAAHEVVPVVPAAAIFDLGRGGEFGARPGPADGFAAVVAAAATEPGAALTQGCVGAGTGAVAGGLKGGVGTASAVLDTAAGPVTVGALVVANAFGSAVDPRDGRLLGARHGLAGEFDDAGRQAGGPMRADGTADGPAGPSSTGPTAPLNTTIGVVATDAVLDRAEAAKIAGLSHDGLARALHPVHTLFDGDTLYALSTGRVALPDADATGYPDRAAHALLLTMIGTAAADCVTRAVCHALLAAETTRTEVGAWTGYRDTAPPA